MGRGTGKNFEPILLFQGGGGWFAISRFRGTREKRHETCQFLPITKKQDTMKTPLIVQLRKKEIS